MSGPLAAPIGVTPAQRAVLTALVRRATCPQALALRARIVLEAAAGGRNEPLARRLDCTPKTVRKWRARWADAAAGLGFSADHSEAHKAWWPDDLSAGPAGGTPPA